MSWTGWSRSPWCDSGGLYDANSNRDNQEGGVRSCMSDCSLPCFRSRFPSLWNLAACALDRVQSIGCCAVAPKFESALAKNEWIYPIRHTVGYFFRRKLRYEILEKNLFVFFTKYNEKESRRQFPRLVVKWQSRHNTGWHDARFHLFHMDVPL